MKLSNFVEGLEILKMYYEDGDGYHIGAEHDIFYAHITDNPLPLFVVKKLIELGWFQPESEVDGGETFDIHHYDPNNGWAAFT